MRKQTLVAGGTILCGVLGLGIWAFIGRQAGVQYRTAAVEHGDVNVAISATGNPNAVVTVQVGSQISGIIMALYADFNTKVTKGQLIARIDPAPFQARVDQGKANLEAAKAGVANALAGVQRAQAGLQASKAVLAASVANLTKSRVATQDATVKAGRRVLLAKEGVLSKEDVDTAQAAEDSARAEQDAMEAQRLASAENVKLAEVELTVARTLLQSSQAQVKQVEAQLRSSQIDLEHTFINAPVDGVVVSRRVDVGQTVAASLAAPTLFEIAQDLTKMQVDTNVSEADVGRVRVGQQATFTVDAYPGKVFHGEVREIRRAPINVQNVITYDVVVNVANPDLHLFPGMTANVKILVNRRTNVMKVPNAALRYRPASESAPATPAAKGGRRNGQAPEQAVWVLEENKPRRVKVTTGETDGTFTEIVSGDLKDGERVIVAAMSKSGGTTTSGPVAQPTGRGGRGPGF